MSGRYVFKIIRTGLRWLLGLVVVVYFVAAMLVIGLRTLILPNIDHYRPQIETLLSRQVGARVTIGRIQAQWARRLRVELHEVQWRDERGWSMLNIPRVEAVLSWRGLFSTVPYFTLLQAHGPDLLLRRDRVGQLWLLGQPLIAHVHDDDMPRVSAPNDTGRLALQWLAAQPQVRVHDARFRWLDESRSAAPLILDGVGIDIVNEGDDHWFSLAARPAHASGQHLEARGRFSHAAWRGMPERMDAHTGTLYLQMDDLRPEDWDTWIAWPQELQATSVSARLWLAYDAPENAQLTAVFETRDAGWRASDGLHVAAQDLQLTVSTPWEPLWQHWRAPGRLLGALPEAGETRARFRVAAQAVGLATPEYYAQPLSLTTLAGRGSLHRKAGGLALQMDALEAANDDFAFGGRLHWRGGSTDHIDAQLKLHRAKLSAVHAYMPLGADEEVRDWLRGALQAGVVNDGVLEVRGPLAGFPFASGRDNGILRLRAPFSDAVLDYVPDDDDQPPWPALQAMRGVLRIDGARLGVRVDSARMRPADGASLALSGVDALIPDLQGKAQLQVNGHVSGKGPDFMAFIHHSPVGGLLGHALAATQAKGDWTLDLGLGLPLAKPDDVRIQGVLSLANSRLQFAPDVPPLEAVDAVLAFDEHALEVREAGLRFLGAPAQLSGGVGRGTAGIRLQGSLSTQALSARVGVPGMARLSGQARYSAHLTGLDFGKGTPPLALEVKSDLKGVALNLPPPLDKPADATLPLRVRWAHGQPSGARTLDIHLGETIQARLEHQPGPGARPYFQRGFLGVDRQPGMPPAGLRVAIRQPLFDADAWDAIVREFTPPSSGEDAGVFPAMSVLSLEAEQAHMVGLPFNDLQLTLSRQGQDRWRADIRARQATGAVDWKQRGTAVDGPLQAVFERLDMEEGSGVSPARWAGLPESTPADEGPDIPAINLKIDRLGFRGHNLGQLIVAGSGAREAGASVWQLDRIVLSSPSLHLEGAGAWRLRGPLRGLTLDASLDVSDLGAYVSTIGYPELLQGGEGQISGLLQWRDFPWSARVDQLSGNLEFNLAKGRLNTVNSRTARLLELLSLQSLQRLARLDLNPAGVGREGFPYDVLRGALLFEAGEVRTRDYRIIGPAGTIVLEGLISLNTGELDLDAVVVPNLDVSGAALAAGVAINPVVGLGAFLGQWLLKTPLASAMTARYRIQGDWENPDIRPVERLAPDDDTPPGR
ncbi:MAG: YhdP family protein [Castellaniella sp.]